MKKYILKTESKTQGTCYYMNCIMLTGEQECAEQYDTKEQAEAEMQHFKNLFYYEEVKPEIVEVEV